MCKKFTYLYNLKLNNMKRSPYFLLLMVFILSYGCKKDDVTGLILHSVEFPIVSVGDSNVQGMATFTEDTNGTTEVLIQLDGTSTSVYPAFIRFNDANEGGSVALTLTSCECNVSHTVVTKLDNGNAISYDDLIILNGHISIHLSSSNLETIVAVANIGSNASGQ